MILCTLKRYQALSKDSLSALISKEESEAIKLASDFGNKLAGKYEFSDKLLEDALDVFTKTVETNAEDKGRIKEIIKEQFENRTKEMPSENYRTALQKYIIDQHIIDYRNQTFRLSAYNSLYIDSDEDHKYEHLYDRIVDNNQKLNSHIEKLINVWFQDIADYYGEKGVFYYNHKRTDLSHSLLNKLYLELDQNTDIQQAISDGYYSFIKGNNDNLAKFFKAFNSYLNIAYFDDILQSQFRSIAINKDLLNPIYQEGRSKFIYKYNFKKYKSDLNKENWNTKDSITDVLEKMGGEVQSTIESIPVYDYVTGSKAQFSGKLTKSLFAQSIFTLIELLNQYTDNKSGMVKVKELLDTLPENPNNLKEILDYLWEHDSDSQFKQYLLDPGNSSIKMTPQQLNILYSFRRGMWTSPSSYDKIEKAYVDEYGVTDRSNVVEAVLAYIAGSVKMRYTQTSYDYDYNRFKLSEISETVSRNNLFNLRQTLNSRAIKSVVDKQSLVDSYGYQNDGQSIIINVTGLNGNQIRLKLDFNDHVIFTENSDKFIRNITVMETGQSVYDYFKDILKLLETSEGTNEVISNKENDSKTVEFYNLLSMIDRLFTTRFSVGKEGLNTLDFLLRCPDVRSNVAKSDFFQGMIYTAIKQLGMYDLYNQIEHDENYTETRDLVTYLKNNNWHGITINHTDEILNKYTTEYLQERQFNLVNDSDRWLVGYQYALDMIQSNFDRSVIDDPAGNKQAKYSNIYLASKYKYRIQEITKNPKDVCNGLLFVENNNSIKGCVTDTYVTVDNGIQKPIQDLNETELYYHDMFDQFFSQLSENGPKDVFVKPFCVADKKKMPVYVIRLSEIFVEDNEGVLRELWQLKDTNNRTKIVEKLYNTLKDYYQRIINNTIEKYNKIFGVSTLEEIQLNLKQLVATFGKDAKYQLSKLAQANGVTLIENIDYIKGLELNPLLLYYSKYTLGSFENFQNEVNRQKQNYIVDLQKRKVRFHEGNRLLNLNGAITFFLNGNKDFATREKYDQQWTKGSQLIISKNGELNPLLDYYFSIYSLLENNLRLMMFDSEVSHTVKKYGKFNGMSLTDAILAGEDMSDPKFSDEIRKVKKEAIIASTKRAGTMSSTLIPLKQLQLNGQAKNMNVAIVEDEEVDVYTPDIKKGGQKPHDGGGFITYIMKVWEDNALHENSVGSIRKPMLGWHNPETGSSTQFKYAINTLSNRYMRDSINCMYDTYSLFKKMTNAIRFGLNEINLVNDAINGELDDLDFSKAIVGEDRKAYYWKLNDKGIKEYRRIIGLEFNEQDQTYYTRELQCDISGEQLEGTSLILEPQLFDDFGEKSNNGTHTISSLFELYQALGGLNSLEHDGKIYVDSELSQEMVAAFGNNVVKKEAEIKEYNQNYIHQPLKEKMIHCVIPLSAVKDGAGNVNGIGTYMNSDALTYITVETTHYGPQNDSDHESDESEVNELTQVMGAVDVGGMMHDQNEIFYEVVGRAIKLFARSEVNAVNEFKNSENGDTNKLYRHLAQLLVDNFDPKKQSGGIGKSIINKIQKELDKFYDQTKVRIHLPFSDPNLYSVLVSTVTSKLNNTAIKKTFSGGGMPMAPSYGFRQIYDINGTTYQFSDILNKILDPKNRGLLESLYAKYGQNYQALTGVRLNQELVRNYLYDLQFDPVERYKADPTTQSSPFIDINDIHPSDVIHFYVNGDLINQRGYAITNLEDYYAFKANPGLFVSNLYNIQVQDGELRYLRSIVTPRDLAPDKMIINLSNGQKINLYDFPIVKERFNLQNVKNINELNNFIQNFNNEYPLWTYTPSLKLTPKNFEVIYNELTNHLQNIYDDVTKKVEDKRIYIDGKSQYEVSNIDKILHEGLFPSIYASKYGLTFRDNVAQILQQGPSKFQHDYTSQRSIATDYNIKFTSSSSKVKEIYVAFDSNVINDNVRPVDWRTTKEEDQYFKTDFYKTNKLIYQRVFYQEDYEKKFLVGVQVLDKKITVDSDGTFRNSSGKILNNKSGRYSKIEIDGQTYALEYIQLVDQYDVSEAENKYRLYNINSKNIGYVENLLNRHANTKFKIEDIIGIILRDMYQVDDYESVYIKDEIRGNMVAPLSKYLRKFSDKLRYNLELRDYIDNVASLLESKKISEEGQKSIIDLSQDEDPEGRTIEDYFNDYDDKRIQYMFSSFQKSLEFVVARIPSQTLQSFMKMKSVGFTNSETNECYVSHIQLFLQGSDFDYDKAYTLGFSISNSGKFVGWSNLFDYSSLETLNKSLELPIPLKRFRIVQGTQTDENLTLYTNNLKQALQSQNRIDILDAEIQLIKYIEKSNKNKNDETVLKNTEVQSDEEEIINGQEDKKTSGIEITISDPEVLKILKDHYLTFKASNNVKEDMLRNYIVNHIGNVITYLPNFQRAHNPVAMDAIRNSTQYAEVKDDQELSFLNPTTILRMQYKNMVGKKATGISANGEKVSFYWNYYFRHKIKYKNVKADGKYSNSPFFKFDAHRIIGRHNGMLKSENVIECLPDINFNNFVDNETNSLFNSFINTIKLRRKLKGKYTSDDLISQLLSVSTDNAKELILEKINGNVDLLKCHLLLFALGVDVEDVVAFMTSPAVTWLANVTQGNIYEGSGLSLQKAINLILNPREDDDFIDDFDDDFVGYAPLKITAPTNEEYSEMNITKDDFREDIKQFQKVLTAANEFTSFATLLRMNQGIPGKDFQDFIHYLGRIKRIVNSAERGKTREEVNVARQNFMAKEDVQKIFNKLKNKGLVDTFDDVFKFDVDLWLNNDDYKRLIADYYEQIKSVVNLFDAILRIPNYKSMFQMLSVANTILETNCLKIRFHKKIYNDIVTGGYTVTDYVNKMIPRYIDEKLIQRFLQKTGINIPVDGNYNIFNEVWDKYQLGQNQLPITNIMDAANFKYLFEEELIYMLQQGKYYDYDSSGNLIIRDSSELADNMFIKNVIKDNNPQDRIPILKLRIDTSDSNKRFLSADYLSELKDLKRAFSKLSTYEFGEVIPSLNRKLNIADLFVLYNLIVNKNRYGRNTFTSLLDFESKNSLLYYYLTNLGELERQGIQDFSDELGYNFEDFKQSVAKKVTKVSSGITEPFVYVDSVGQRNYYFKNIYGRFVKDAEATKQFGATERDRIEKTENMLFYGVLSSNLSQYVQRSLVHLDLDNMFNTKYADKTRKDHINYSVKFLSDKIEHGKLFISINC